jgi:hypothetical protein
LFDNISLESIDGPKQHGLKTSFDKREFIYGAGSHIPLFCKSKERSSFRIEFNLTEERPFE